MFAAPTAGLPEPLVAWVVGLTVAAGIAHLVAAVGLVRARRWAASLTGYLAAAGVAASVFAILMIARAEVDILGASGATTAAFFGFMIAWFVIGARFALHSFAPASLTVRPTATTAATGAAPAPTATPSPSRGYVIRPMGNVTFA
jgi:hypothetical protein